jgi:hypothetical protein
MSMTRSRSSSWPQSVSRSTFASAASGKEEAAQRGGRVSFAVGAETSEMIERLGGLLTPELIAESG